jgi:hypothetical protein
MKITTLKDALVQLANNDQLLDEIIYLSERWKSEKKYEDFNIYESRIKEMVTGINKEVVFINATKAPMGLVFGYPGDARKVTLQLNKVGKGVNLKVTAVN